MNETVNEPVLNNEMTAEQIEENNKTTNLLRQNKLFLATPMYGGQCTGIYTKSISELNAICAQIGIPIQTFYLFNESLITRARNYCVDEFLRSDATHFIFVDSDIGFDPRYVLNLMALQANEPEKYNIIGGPYPKKSLSWEKIKYAVDKGIADDDPNILEKYVGDYVFNPLTTTGSVNLGQPVEVLELGTGFMMIHRNVFEKFKAKYPQYMYIPDHVRSKQFDGSREIMMFFQAEIDDNKRYLSEDYWFTQKTRNIGIKTWICPWMELKHMGTYVFGGSLIDLVKLGVAATADPSKLGTKN